MKLIPWKQVRYWRCLCCGNGCQFTVQLTTKEWLNLIKLYGHAWVEPRIDGFYIKKIIGKRCPFLHRFSNRNLCSIQRIKPLACKIWPFKILDNPRYSSPSEAHYKSRYGEFYIYIHSYCPGIIYGKPSEQLINHVLSEFIEIRLGLIKQQIYSTSR
ncbi:MAG: YkgJ family cysteine cluster protein [Candidatus Bathyarchaeota archaeon]|nr:MAG: YkgJ family cysteine cluster protein [Candidatus Bathyarchaeota archaeon]